MTNKDTTAELKAKIAASKAQEAREAVSRAEKMAAEAKTAALTAEAEALRAAAVAKKEAEMVATAREASMARTSQNSKNSQVSTITYAGQCIATSLTTGLGGALSGLKIATELNKLGASLGRSYPNIISLSRWMYNNIKPHVSMNTWFREFYVYSDSAKDHTKWHRVLQTNLAIVGAGAGVVIGVPVSLLTPVMTLVGAINIFFFPAFYGFMPIAAGSMISAAAGAPALSVAPLVVGAITAEAATIAVQLYNDYTSIGKAIVNNKLGCMRDLVGGVVLGAKASANSPNTLKTAYKVIGGLGGTISCLAGAEDDQVDSDATEQGTIETIANTLVSGVETVFHIATGLACIVMIAAYVKPMLAGAAAVPHPEHHVGGAEGEEGF